VGGLQNALPPLRGWLSNDQAPTGLRLRHGSKQERHTLFRIARRGVLIGESSRRFWVFFIGIDPHKASHTAAVLDGHEQLVCEVRVHADRWQRDRLLAFAARFEPRCWAIEGATGTGALLAQQLVAIGETVLDVPPALSARVRLLDNARGHPHPAARSDPFGVSPRPGRGEQSAPTRRRQMCSRASSQRRAATIARTTAREARAVIRNGKRGLVKLGAHATGRQRGLINELETLTERVERIAAQTRERVIDGLTPAGATRIVSLHDPDARPIAKGRLGKPVEFGYKAQLVDNEEASSSTTTSKSGTRLMRRCSSPQWNGSPDAPAGHRAR
jgi:hypothetical protein